MGSTKAILAFKAIFNGLGKIQGYPEHVLPGREPVCSGTCLFSNSETSLNELKVTQEADNSDIFQNG